MNIKQEVGADEGDPGPETNLRLLVFCRVDEIARGVELSLAMFNIIAIGGGFDLFLCRSHVVSFNGKLFIGTFGHN